MSVSWLIAKRELFERIQSRSFLSIAIIGPLLILGLVYLLFSLSEKNKTHWNVLIADPNEILDTKILSNQTGSLTYDFANDYVQLKDFEKGVRFQKYDALLEVNEKILSNKVAFVFYREKPSLVMATGIQFHLERRLEEILIERFTSLTIKDYRRIKQPVNIGYRNIYDPKNEEFSLGSWVGFSFGTVTLFFILLFGMTILRSVSSEKSNRIVEVILASVKPRQLMLGKITGIGIAAIIQFVIWLFVISLGLYIMRETMFTDWFDASNWDIDQLAESGKNPSQPNSLQSSMNYNNFVELIYNRIQFDHMIIFFLLFFVGGYIFYGTFFAALGASSGSENDGQQFVIPILILLLFALWSGYYVLCNPSSEYSLWLSFIPFTSPMVCLVKLAQGYPIGQGYQLFVSLGILISSSLFMLRIAGRLYTNGILQYGHRLRLHQFLKWIKNG